MVDDAAEHQAATIVLMDEIERILDKNQPLLVVIKTY